MRLVFAMTAAIVLQAGAAAAGERFPNISVDQMTPDQKRVAEAIMAGPRGRLSGPFNAWLRSPELGDRLQKVGEFVRFKTSLPPRLNELAILITAREWTSQYEWYAHHPLALKAGLDPQVAADIAADKRPAGMKDDEALVYEFSTQLHRTKHVDDKTFDAAVEKFGEQGVIDLIGVNGYYGVVSMTLNVAKVPVPPGSELPLKPLSR